MPAAAFDPKALLDDETGRYSFTQVPVYEVLATLAQGALTGVLGVWVNDKPSRLYFREGRPVGVQLGITFAPLGQLLLEMGYVDSGTFLKAMPLIESTGRLSGQVYVELGVLDNSTLKKLLSSQADRKARRFVELCVGPFEFSRGLSFLTGFSAANISGDMLVLLALAMAFKSLDRDQYLQELGTTEVRALVVSGEALGSFGFGPAEAELIAHLQDWRRVDELVGEGKLPRGRVALLLKLLDVRQQLQLREASTQPVAVLPTRAPRPRVPGEDIPTEKLDRAAVAAALGSSPPPREPTERVSVPSGGWSDPVEAREEKTEQNALPSIMVDFGALATGPRKH